MVEPDVPYDSPLRTHKKRGLPDSFASTYAHGHISGHPRTPAQEKAFEQARAKFLRQLNAEQMEEQYWETVKKINAILEEDQKHREEIDREIVKLKAQRELERRIFWKQKEDKELKEKTKREASAAAAPPATEAAAQPTTVTAPATDAAAPAPIATTTQPDADVKDAPPQEQSLQTTAAATLDVEKTADGPAEVKQETET